jgi:acyl-coenzyme A synthetase/AMP-(fatty) acid ligase
MAAQSWWGADVLDRGAHDVVWLRAGNEITGERLRREIGMLAGLLRTHGVRSNNTVALQGTSSFTLLWSILALWSLGAQVLLLEPRLGQAERTELLDRCAPQFLVNVGGLHYRGGVFLDECEVLVRRLPGGQEARSSHCVVQFSSGTTGQSKIIGRTSESLLVELDRLRALDGMPTAGERVAVLEPVTHSFGLIGGLLHALSVGAVAVFPADQDPRAIAAAATPSHVVLGNPGHFAALARLPGVVLPHLRLAVSSGEMLSRRDFEAFRRRYGIRVGQAYGTTETGIVATDFAGAAGPPTVGLPVPGVRTRVLHDVLQVHVPQSPYLFEHEPWLGGWLSTQDIVDHDPHSGAIRLRGRTGHTDPHLVEIESVLHAHQQVVEAVALGMDPIEAYVASATDLDHGELTAWCQRFLGNRAKPAAYYVARELPRTANGKVLRCRAGLRRHMTMAHTHSDSGERS